MTTETPVQTLARLMADCDCDMCDSSHASDEWCSRCDHNGQVPRFPMLPAECQCDLPIYPQCIACINNDEVDGRHAKDCRSCHGGWLPVSEDTLWEAAVSLGENGYLQVITELLKLTKSKGRSASILGPWVYDWGKLTPREREDYLAQAVLKVVGHDSV